MSLVVSDASPIHYLILIGATDVLPSLFAKVIIPGYVVSDELQDPKTPHPVREWIRDLPQWVEVRTPANPTPLGLETGEEHAIALALELNSAVLLDEREARRVAEGKGLLVVGTVGVLERAAQRRLLDLKDALDALQRTNFRISQALIDEAIRRNSGRTPPSG